jgi:ankyrin repeat protein
LPPGTRVLPRAAGFRFVETSLHLLLGNSKRELIVILLEKSADINTQERYYGNALQVALASDYLEVVGLLLEKSVDVNAVGGYYENALQAASRNSN